MSFDSLFRVRIESGDGKARVRVLDPFEAGGAECGAGWATLYDPVVKALEAFGCRVACVWELDGGLRIEFLPPDGDETPGAIASIVTRAEVTSFAVCEWCGRSGTLRSVPTTKTLCDECQGERELNSIRLGRRI